MKFAVSIVTLTLALTFFYLLLQNKNPIESDVLGPVLIDVVQESEDDYVRGPHVTVKPKRINESQTHSLKTETTLTHVRALKSAPSLEETVIWLKSLDGERFEKLNSLELEKMTDLNLSNLDIRDEDMIYLSNFPNLDKLYLCETKVSDLGMKILNDARLPVTTMYLGSTLVTDKGIASISTMSHLRCLSLRHTQIGDLSVKYLACMSELETLSVRETNVTGEGVNELSKMNNLETLYLGGEHITLQSLNALSSMKSLSSLNLNKVSLSKEELDSFEEKMPNCDLMTSVTSRHGNK